jgi:hypothetical protein
MSATEAAQVLRIPMHMRAYTYPGNKTMIHCKPKMTTTGYCSGKNTAPTELIKRVTKITLEKEYPK